MDKLIFHAMGKNTVLDIPMEYDSLIDKKIQSGEVQVLSSPQSCDDKGNITFSGQQTKKIDCVIYTTGFKQNFSHLAPLSEFVIATGLKGGFEHPSVQGLYFLGLDQQRNFRSRFLRGMREDAAQLASILSNKV